MFASDETSIIDAIVNSINGKKTVSYEVDPADEDKNKIRPILIKQRSPKVEDTLMASLRGKHTKLCMDETGEGPPGKKPGDKRIIVPEWSRYSEMKPGVPIMKALGFKSIEDVTDRMSLGGYVPIRERIKLLGTFTSEYDHKDTWVPENKKQRALQISQLGVS